jgi:ferric-dicitrate binding protein FerR (iron transport regulator)
VTTFPDEVLSQTRRHAQAITSHVQAEVPLRLHSSAIADDGSPQWSRDFLNWLTHGERSNSDAGARTRRAFRRLRKTSPRSFEVLFRLIILHQSIEQITAWLNERAARNAIPLPAGLDRHYRAKDCMALVICGVDFVTSEVGISA